MFLRVVFDTTSVREIKGRMLSGPDFDLLYKGITSLGIEAYLPLVVYEELVNQFHQGLLETLRKLEGAYSSLENFLPDAKAGKPKALNVDDAVREYKKRLDEQIRKYSIKIITYDEISHKSILDRAIRKRRPFSESGKGYQDALIWEGVLSLDNHPGMRTALITNNSTDFCAKGGNSLHEHLQQELASRSVPDDSIFVCKSISEFNEKFVTPQLAAIPQSANLDSGDWTYKNFSLVRFFEEKYEDFIDHIRKADPWLPANISSAMMINAEITNIEIKSLGSPEFIFANVLVSIQKDQVATIIRFRSNGDWNMDIPRQVVHLVDREKDFTIVDQNVSPYAMRIGVSLEILFTITLILNDATGLVEQWVVSSAEMGA